ncbi:hypothetical protein ABVF61_31325 [Roseibium sp. HPY-6]|uniref:antitoxin VbhA family protein n=1 Tax=Roseibium sp. HPY-6 TaxID=3229852 RepID=UPI00338FBA4B
MRSDAAVEVRRKAVEQAIASIKRQGYQHDSALEVSCARFIAGDLTAEELHEEILQRFQDPR